MSFLQGGPEPVENGETKLWVRDVELAFGKWLPGEASFQGTDAEGMSENDQFSVLFFVLSHRECSFRNFVLASRQQFL